MNNVSILLAALLLSGIVGASCAPLIADESPYSPEEWQRRMDLFFDDRIEAT